MTGIEPNPGPMQPEYQPKGVMEYIVNLVALIDQSKNNAHEIGRWHRRPGARFPTPRRRLALLDENVSRLEGLLLADAREYFLRTREQSA